MKKTKATAGEPLELEAEDLGVQSEVSLAVTKVVNEEVTRLDKYEQRIQDFKDKYSGLTIDGVDDREQIEAVTLAVRDMRTVRVNTGKEKVAAKAPFWNACKFLEEKADYIQTEIAKIEAPLKNRLDEIAEEKEKIKIEKKRLADEQLMIRQQTLTKLGAEYKDGNFVLGDISFDAATIRESDIEIFHTDILPLYQSIYDEKQSAIAAEAARLAQVELDAKTAREKLEAEQLAFRQQQAAFEAEKQAAALKAQQEADRIALEKEESKKKLLRSRAGTLQALGMTYNYRDTQYEYGDLTFDINEKDLPELSSDEDFNTKVIAITEKINEVKAAKEKQRIADEAEKERLQTIAATGRARKSFLNSLGVDYGTIESLGVIDSQEWEGLQKGYQETYNTKQAEKKDAERLENERKEKEKQQAITDGLNDKGKLEAFKIDVMKLVVPTFKSSQYKKLGTAMQDKVNELLAMKAEITNQYSK